mmetsp:Transcript_7953/g.24940  ORF Transcript_7953/g.24940 Transcript_7953/m.24940 type:complete len:304 (-) Transcript_7953:43-954(-)|eukprot:CAMPEP_0196769874 /NCGR_PEP_ID=MMETSP1104-20130614/801_1 /TAXON_ID=33652 /ORGANISM="Cafeteria sp., Strain Caron Lab Isolate" /LENGTH=303 /DNA_ID=CAMNT_0042139977 /DNA_START=35 /DNA_END=946 /DNA_ORIENTATION=+
MSQGGSGFLLALVSAGVGAAGATALYTSRPDLLQKAGTLMSTNASEALMDAVKKITDAAKAAMPSKPVQQEAGSAPSIVDAAPAAPVIEATSAAASDAAQSVAVALPEAAPAAATVAAVVPPTAATAAKSGSGGSWMPISGRSASVLVVLTGGAVAAAYVLDERAKAKINAFLAESRVRALHAYDVAGPIARRAAAGTAYGLNVAWTGCKRAAAAAAVHAKPAAEKAGAAIGAAASKAYTMVVPPPLAPMQQEDPSAAADPGAPTAEAKDEAQVLAAGADMDADAGAGAGAEAVTPPPAAVQA